MTIPGLEQLEAMQQPIWPDPVVAKKAVSILESNVPLVSKSQTDELTKQIAKAQGGEAFLLQAGSCAESFDDGPDEVRRLLDTKLAMNMVLSYAAGVPVVKVARIAGQYAKPRSSDTETHGDVTLPSFRGDIVNGYKFSEESRRHDPLRMIDAYEHASKTISTLQELATGGYADIDRIHDWNVEFAKNSAQKDRYLGIVEEIGRAIRFMKSAGVNTETLQELHEAHIYTSHEGLLLDYETALTRETEDGLYATSAHMLWIGERTRQLDGAHVGYFAQIQNPREAKIGPSATPDQVLGLCDALNPDRLPGRLTLITRMGKDAIRGVLPAIVRSVKAEGHPVLWVSDPMHGNTVTADSGHKTRRFEDIVEEVNGFFDVCENEDVWPGGLHLEVTGHRVTECLGGSQPNEVLDLSKNYVSSCDPRLNGDQAIELAFRVAERLDIRHK